MVKAGVHKKSFFYKPFVKWVGGKRQLLKLFDELMPKDFNSYFEPFVGGGAVFFHLRNLYGNGFAAHLYDINQELITTYNVIKNKPQELINELQKFVYDKEQFLEVRARDRVSNYLQKKSSVQRAARFMYLNRTCFNGLYRVNKLGQFNVPFGRYANPLICDEETILAAHEALKYVTIKHNDFGNVADYVEKNDFVYFDPPYDVLTETANFTSYNESGFGRDEQVRLRDTFVELDKQGCKVMLSNHNTPFIQEIFAGYRIEVIEATRAINSNANKRGKVEEVVVLNY